MVSTYIVIGSIVAAVAIAGLIGAFIMSEEDDIMKFISKWYFKAQAKAEMTALQNAGSEQAQGFLKEKLKDNPMVDNEEISQVSEGLGGDAAKGLKDLKF